MADPADDAKDSMESSMESLSWPDTSRPIVNYGSSDPGGFGQSRGYGFHPAMPRRRWPVVVAILILLVIVAVVAVIWVF